MKLFKWFCLRIKEPSTYAGLSALGILFGLPPGTIDVAIQVAGAVCAIGAMIMPESN